MVIEARRIVFPAIRQAQWETYSVPAEPDAGAALKPHEVLVRTACTLVSAGTEIAIYSGNHIGFRTPGATYPRMPFHPGYASAGTVVAIGDAVTTFRPGDRVCGSQRHEPWSVVSTESGSRLLPLPEGVSFEQGCLSRLASIAVQGVRLARVQLGERAAVFGQGLIGQFARQVASLDGATTTIAIDRIDARLNIGRRHGATHIFNPDRDDISAAVASATGGSGADVVIEATGSPAVINTALGIAANLGRVILLGSPRGKVEIDPYNDIHRKGVALIGAHANTAAAAPNAYHRWTSNEHQLICLELMRQGRLLTEGLVTHRLAETEALGVFEALTEQPENYLGVTISWE
ncbi:MAG TPA: zinc-binding alcohol dehydrogenase [Chloroflexota bacterium]|nr:zinc-binding alcohol dehydrogenase [Chloroflexota bacterium]